MKKIWNSFKIAFSMYSKIPMPHSEWTEENMSYAMCFFPWIGAVIGAVTWGLYCLRDILDRQGIRYHDLFFTVLLVLVPLLITGGIHMDGFLDTQDALSSYQPKERRLEILKDSHAGAFAIISCAVYMVAYVGVYSSLTADSVKVIGISFMLSRTLSGLSVVCFPQARKKGLVATFAGKAAKRTTRSVLAGYLVVICVVLIVVGGITGGAAAAIAGLVFLYYYHMCMTKFGGITGDLAGYFLQMCELLMALGVVVLDGILKGPGI